MRKTLRAVMLALVVMVAAFWPAPSFADGGQAPQYGDTTTNLPTTGFPAATVATVAVVLLIFGLVLTIAFRRRDRRSSARS